MIHVLYHKKNIQPIPIIFNFTIRRKKTILDAVN